MIHALGAGLLFGVGLWLSGMANPRKVLDFLDITGNWDPSLLLVMGGAVAVTAATFRPLIRKRDLRFDKTAIDIPLVAGAAIFGIGWGISGYCPGPAIASLAAPNWETWVFIPSVLLGAYLHRLTTISPEETARTRCTEGSPASVSKVHQ